MSSIEFKLNITDIQKEVADQYQGLFNLMAKKHKLILTISEMDDIIIEAQKVVKAFTERKHKNIK